MKQEIIRRVMQRRLCKLENIGVPSTNESQLFKNIISDDATIFGGEIIKIIPSNILSVVNSSLNHNDN